MNIQEVLPNSQLHACRSNLQHTTLNTERKTHCAFKGKTSSGAAGAVQVGPSKNKTRQAEGRKPKNIPEFQDENG